MLTTIPDSSATTMIGERRAMIDSQLRTNGVNDPAIIAAFGAVDRAAFVPAEQRAASYIDRAVPLGGGRAMNPPLTTARLISELGNISGQRVLLLGAATGYTAAVLASMGAHVVAVESDEALHAFAATALTGIAGVTLVSGALTAGAPDHAPYDALMVDGAIENVPSAILAQLSPGAIISSGITEGAVTRLGRSVAVSGAASVQLHGYTDLECVRLPGFSPPPRFSF